MATLPDIFSDALKWILISMIFADKTNDVEATPLYSFFDGKDRRKKIEQKNHLKWAYFRFNGLWTIAHIVITSLNFLYAEKAHK